MHADAEYRGPRLSDFESVGDNVTIDPMCRVFRPEKIRIGSNVRIDAFAIISAGDEGVSIGSHIHIAAGCYLFGTGGRITLDDFSNLSSRVSLYSTSDDFVEGYMTSPMIPVAYKRLTTGPIRIGRHAIIGSGSVVLPGVEIGDGASVGAMTLVRRDVEPGSIVYGNPMRVSDRKRDTHRLARLEKAFLDSDHA